MPAGVGALCPSDEQCWNGERSCSSRAGEQLDTCRHTCARHPPSRGTSGQALPSPDLGSGASHHPCTGSRSAGHGRNPAGPGCPGAGAGEEPAQPPSPGRARLALLTRQGSIYGAAAAIAAPPRDRPCSRPPSLCFTGFCPPASRCSQHMCPEHLDIHPFTFPFSSPKRAKRSQPCLVRPRRCPSP